MCANGWPLIPPLHACTPHPGPGIRLSPQDETTHKTSWRRWWRPAFWRRRVPSRPRAPLSVDTMARWCTGMQQHGAPASNSMVHRHPTAWCTGTLVMLLDPCFVRLPWSQGALHSKVVADKLGCQHQGLAFSRLMVSANDSCYFCGLERLPRRPGNSGLWRHGRHSKPASCTSSLVGSSVVGKLASVVKVRGRTAEDWGDV